MQEFEFTEDTILRVFFEFNQTPVGTGFDTEFAKYADFEYKAGDKIKGEPFDIKGKYMNIKFPDGSVGVGIPRNIIGEI